ncbi:MAG: alpha/beta hydrolase [Promethearchaeota archaeon]
MKRKFLDGAESLYIKGSTTGCLLLHGAGGGTTWDLKDFAYTLNSKLGTSIWLPTLSGFGTDPQDLYNVTFSDWLHDAHEGINILQQKCEHIFVLGHSMGGILALLLASERKEINAIVTWAAALNVKSCMLSFLPIINKIPLIKRVIPEKFSSLVPETLKEQGWVGYDWIPTSIGFTVLEALRKVKQSLKNVTCPAFIIQGTMDELVSLNSARQIYESISSSKKELWYVEGAPHPIMNDDLFKVELYTRTINFLKEVD